MTKTPPISFYLWVQGTMSLLMGVMWTIFSIYLIKEAHLDPLQLILTGTAIEVTAFLCEVPTGVVADHYSRRLSVIIGVALMGGGVVLLSLTTNFGLILLSQVIEGVGFTFISGAFEAWLTDEIGEDRVGDVLLASSQISTLAGLGGILLGTLVGIISLGLPLLISGVALIALAGMMALLMEERNFHPTARAEGHSPLQAMVATFQHGLRVVKGRQLAFVVLAIGFFFGAFSEGYDRLWENHFLVNFAFPFPELGWNAVIWFGIIRAVGSILSYFAAGVARRRVDTTNTKNIAQALFWVNCGLVGALFGFALAGNFWLAFIAKEFATLTRTVNEPLYTTWLNQNLDSKVRATVLSMSNQLDALGQFAGGPVVGWVGSGLGVKAAILFSAALLTPVLPMFAYAMRHKDKALIAEPETVSV